MKDVKISLNTKLILCETSVGQIFHVIWNSLFDIAQSDTKHYCHQLPLNGFGNVRELIWKQEGISKGLGEMTSIHAVVRKIKLIPLPNHMQSISHVIWCLTCTKNILLFDEHKWSEGLYQRLRFPPCCFTAPPSMEHWIHWV